MIKDIVLNLPIEPSSDATTAFAISVAMSCSAHLTGIAFQYDPLVPVVLMDGIPPDVIESQRVEAARVAKEAISKFEKAVKDASLLATSRMIDASVAGASDRFGHIARRFDLSILGQPEPGKFTPEELIIESALFSSGRPVLVVPYIQKAGLGLERAMVCWDGSRNAARAVADAMPFLSRFKHVQIVIVDSGSLKSEEIVGADIAQHVSRHGIHCDVERIVSPDVDVANVILSRAADAGTDLLVMGGYGHSRLREFILGGVTRDILKTMTVPTLMSH